MNKLLSVLIGVIVIAALVWLVNSGIPGIPDTVRLIADVITLIVAIVWGARLLGVDTQV